METAQYTVVLLYYTLKIFNFLTDQEYDETGQFWVKPIKWYPRLRTIYNFIF